jgi:NADH-quinone oxidoreductase subunit K
MVPANYYLVLATILFAIGTIGVIVRRNVITMFMCIELMLNAVNLTFITLSRSLNQVDGQIIVFFVMTVAAAEAAVGLALIVVLSRRSATLDVDQADSMKW